MTGIWNLWLCCAGKMKVNSWSHCRGLFVCVYVIFLYTVGAEVFKDLSCICSTLVPQTIHSTWNSRRKSSMLFSETFTTPFRVAAVGLKRRNCRLFWTFPLEDGVTEKQQLNFYICICHSFLLTPKSCFHFNLLWHTKNIRHRRFLESCNNSAFW